MVDLIGMLPKDWRTAMRPHLDPAVVAQLNEFVADEYAKGPVFPPLPQLFQAFALCPLGRARVLILGQDPYHRQGQAHGLSFSVPDGVVLPPSLRNVFAELSSDLGLPLRRTGDLTDWARQGVLLLNAVLTVRAGAAASHAKRGWEHVTDAAILALNEQPRRVVFLLWGAYARQKAKLVTGPSHVIVESGHPSPMNQRGFLGSRPFSACNTALAAAGETPIVW